MSGSFGFLQTTDLFCSGHGLWSCFPLLRPPGVSEFHVPASLPLFKAVRRSCLTYLGLSLKPHFTLLSLVYLIRKITLEELLFIGFVLCTRHIWGTLCALCISNNYTVKKILFFNITEEENQSGLTANLVFFIHFCCRCNLITYLKSVLETETDKSSYQRG